MTRRIATGLATLAALILAAGTGLALGTLLLLAVLTIAT